MRTATETAAGPRQIVAGPGAGRSLLGVPPGSLKRTCPPSAPGKAGGSAALTSATAASARTATEVAATAARTAARMTPGSTAVAAPPGTMATAATVLLTAATSRPVRSSARKRVRRSARGRRNDDGDWPSTEWDKLSDADYWKEVASDKPLVTTARVAQPAQEPRSAPPALSRETVSRDSAGRDAGIQPGHQPSGRQAARRGEEPKREATRPPGRGPLEPAGAGVVHDFLTAPTAARYPEPVRRDPVRPDPGRPDQVRPRLAGPAGRPAEQRAAAPMPLDDDPLTSPSFPKIVTSDSRSYHNGRSSASASARPSGPPAQPAAGGRPADQGAYGAPTAQFAIPGQHSPGPPWPVARWRRHRGRLWPRLRRRQLGGHGTAFLRPGRRAAGGELSGERLSVAGARRGDRSRLPGRPAAARPSPDGRPPASGVAASGVAATRSDAGRESVRQLRQRRPARLRR